jgi:hypothetical protein
MRRRSQLVIAFITAISAVCAVQGMNRVLLPANVSTLAWDEDWPEFGGWSGLEVTADGGGFWVVSDGSSLAKGVLEYQDGRLVGVTAQRIGFVSTPDPANPGDRVPRDAEGLALMPDGTPLVSFERNTRFLPVRPDGTAGPPLPITDELRAMQKNSGLEALAVDEAGAVYAVPERSGEYNRPFPVFRFADGQWTTTAYLPRTRGWLPVGADFGPSGAFFLLERRFLFGGFATRVRKFDLDNTVETETLVYQSPAGRHGNLEGLAVWTDQSGVLHLTMVSDHNFFFFQRTQFVDVIAPKSLASDENPG